MQSKYPFHSLLSFLSIKKSIIELYYQMNPAVSLKSMKLMIFYGVLYLFILLSLKLHIHFRENENSL